MKLALVSADSTFASTVAFAAQRRGHQVVTLREPRALLGTLPFVPSLVVLDFPEPGALEAAQIIGQIRKQLDGVALFVVLEKPQGPLATQVMQAGAHQVITAPFNPHELVLRAEAWSEGHQSGAGPVDILKLGDLEVALDGYVARKNGREVTLTRLELRLLYCLCDHSPNIAPTERLLTFGWATLGDPEPALIKTHISHLRRKLADAGGAPVEILSRQSVGYLIRAAEGSSEHREA